MSVRDDGSTEGTRPWPPAFESDLAPLAGFVVVFSVLLVAVNVVIPLVLGPDPHPLLERASAVPWKIVEALLAVLVLRYEGVRVRDIGLDPRLALPAVVAAIGVAIVVNATVATLVVLDGQQLSVGLGAFFLSPPLNYSTEMIVVGGVVAYAFTGPAEELAFRGYLQNKLVARFGGGGEWRWTLLGIVVAGTVFAAAHLPSLLLGGGSVTAVLPTLGILAFSGITFGLLYETTRNLYLVALLHGFGNHYPLFVDPGTWPNWPLIIVVYALMVLVYRRWAVRTARPTHGIGNSALDGA